MTVAIITAIYDNYDTLKPILKQSIDVKWICVTDDIKLCLPNHGWRIVYEPRSHIQPNRAAKTPKCLPLLYTDAKSSIWIDASFQITSSTFAEEVLEYADPIAQFEHPWRDCIYDEAEESIKLHKYQDQEELIHKQMWIAKNIHFHPAHWGLWANGVIARHHTYDVIEAGHEWLSDIYNFSYQDQLSWADRLRHNGLRPVNLPGSHLANNWLEYKGSGRH